MSRLGFRSCGTHSSFGGLVGTPLRKRFVDDKEWGRCPKCKVVLHLESAEIIVGDICPRCKEATIKQKKRVIEYCPDCEREKEMEE